MCSYRLLALHVEQLHRLLNIPGNDSCQSSAGTCSPKLTGRQRERDSLTLSLSLFASPLHSLSLSASPSLPPSLSPYLPPSLPPSLSLSHPHTW